MGVETSRSAGHKLHPFPGSFTVTEAVLVWADLLAAGTLGMEACGNEFSIQTLWPRPGRVTEGGARTIGLAGLGELGHRENPPPGRLSAGVAGLELVLIQRLWPSPGNRREEEDSMERYLILIFMVFRKSVRRWDSCESREELKITASI